MEQLRVCIISKYPPIQGGMSSAAYWLANGLAQVGVEVHVVTDGNLVEKEYRIDDKPKKEIQGVNVHHVHPEIPWYIPNTEQRLAKLVDTALGVCNKYNISLVDAQYLVPYGFAGSIINAFTGIPYVIRHGGSDIAKFFNKGFFPLLMERALSGAALTVSDNPVVSNLAKAVKCLHRYMPPDKEFVPNQLTNRSLTCAYIGKINYHWEHKGLHKIANIVKGSGIQMLYLGQGKGMDNFIQTCKPEGVFYNFIHPSRMPDFLSQTDYLFYFKANNPIPDFSNLILEAVSMGVPILTDRADLFDKYQDYFDVDQWVIQLDPSLSGKVFAQFIKDIKKPQAVPLNISYDSYVQENITLYRNVLIA